MSRTLLVKFTETDTLYWSWRWQDTPGEVEAGKLKPEFVAGLRQALAQVMPEPHEGESGDAALERALTESLLSNPEGSQQLGQALGQALFAAEMVEQLRAERDRGSRPRLRVQPSPTTARVPWPLVRIGPEAEPLISLVNLEFAPPAALAVSARTPNHQGKTVVAVIDPRVPGASPTSALGSVLGRPREDDALAQLLRHGALLRPEAENYLGLTRRRDLDPAWVREQLADAARFLYVGHATSGETADAGASSALHLAGPGPHRPITAAQIVQEQWQLPPRCALIACGSASELRDLEPMGLTLAALNGGAELVTATAWRLPIDAAIALFGRAATDRQPLRELVLAVDTAHEFDDPVLALADWQRERLHAWEASGSIADTPLVWAAATTFTRSAN